MEASQARAGRELREQLSVYRVKHQPTLNGNGKGFGLPAFEWEALRRQMCVLSRHVLQKEGLFRTHPDTTQTSDHDPEAIAIRVEAIAIRQVGGHR